ncbi:oligosaccharide flippase family protein [Halobacillus seohaensis]|uniref:Oligosaccharide flippase family protein n=1 Tax=Halobacillus seohaensis TaxID=447421 RepID=A0ABW2EJJ1_9BACI
MGSDAVKLTIAKLVAMVTSFLTAMILSRFLTLEEFGTYTQLLLIINFITAIFVLGLPNSVNYFLARAESRKQQQNFVSVYYSLSTILSFLAGLFLLFTAQIFIDFFSNPLLSHFIYFLAIFPWAKIILSSIDHVLIVYQKVNYLFAFRLINSTLLLSVVLVSSIMQLDFGIYIGLFLTVEVFLTICVYLIVRNISGKLVLKLDIPLIKEIFKFSVPIGLATVVGMLSVQLDKIIISQFYPPEKLAIYANAAREIPIAIVASSLTAVIMPKIVRLLKKGRNNNALELWGNGIFISYTVICFSATALIIFAPEVITVLYSKKYLDGVVIFQIYCLVLLLRSTYFGMILSSMGKTKIILYSSLGALALNVILNYVFYFVFGLIGPAIATFVSILAINIFQLIFTSKYLNISFRTVFPWKDLLNISIVNVAMGVIFLLIKIFVHLDVYLGDVIESIILGIIWLGFYLLLMKNQVKKKWEFLK